MKSKKDTQKGKEENKMGKIFDEFEKYLLTQKSKMEKESQKTIDEDFDANFSMENNFLAIQSKLAKLKNENPAYFPIQSEIEGIEGIEGIEDIETSKKEFKKWVKPAPLSFTDPEAKAEPEAKTVKLGKKLGKIEEKATAPQQNQWVKPAPLSSFATNSTSVTERNATNLPTTKTVSLRKFWVVAASLTALLVTTLGYHFETVSMLTQENEQLISLYENTGDNGEEGQEQEEQEQENYSQTVVLPAELMEAEDYYTSIIAKEKKELKQKDTKNWVTSETIQTLDELDEAYKIMKEDLLDDQNPKKIVDEMLQNLRLRKQILEESMQILEQAKTSSSNSETKKTQKNNDTSI